VPDHDGSRLLGILSRPVDHVLPLSTWSLAKLAEFPIADGLIDDVSHEDLRAPSGTFQKCPGRRQRPRSKG
jgi:hypothetical protein